MKLDCFLICRVSSAEQLTGYSLDAQSRMGKEYISEKSFQLVETFIFQESASKATEQKKFDEIMGRIYVYISKNNKPLVIVVEKKDRWGRLHSRKELIQNLVLQGKVIVHYFRERQIMDRNCGPEEIFMDDVMTSLNKFQSINIGKESKKGMTEKAKQGWLPHKPAIGYINNPDKESEVAIQINESERKLIHRIFELRAEQNYSYANIAAQVIEECLVPKKRLSSFKKSTVEKILKNKFYDGIFTLSGVEYEGRHELIVPHHFRKKVYDSFNKPGVILNRRLDGLYADFLTCGICGCKITYHQKKKPSGRVYHFYVCANGKKKHETLKGMYVNEDVISQKFESVLDSFAIQETLAERLAKALNANHLSLQAKLRHEEASYRRSLKKLEIREDELYDDLKKGLFDEEFYKRKIDEVRKERARFADLLITIESSVSEIYLQTAQDVLELAKNAKLYWNHLNNSEKVQMLKKVVWNPRLVDTTIEYEMKKPFKILLEMKGLSNNEKWGG